MLYKNKNTCQFRFHQIKKYLFSTLTLISVFTIIFIGCASAPDNFTCTVNGIAFKVDQSYAKYREGVLTICAVFSEPENADIAIQISADRPNTYICDQNQAIGNIARYRILKGPANLNIVHYRTSSSCIGKIVITTLDVENMKVSGTYEFEAVQESDNSETVDAKGTFENLPVRSE